MLSWSTVPYDRPLPRPIATAHGVFTRRQGFLLRVSDCDGLYGLGDVAPLPGLSSDSVNPAMARWNTIHDRIASGRVPGNIEQLSDQMSDLRPVLADVPSLFFGIETALADLSARHKGRPLAQWLNQQAVRGIEVNALLSARDPGRLRQSAQQKRREGFHTFKIKVGVCSLEHDIERIAAVGEAVPDAQIRVDANTAWDESQFRHACRHLSPLGLEFVEQPLPVGQASVAHGIAGEYGIPLALDEEVRSVDLGLQFIRDKTCDVLVLKPMVVGGLSGCLRLAAEAHRHDIGIVVTSVWESDVGVAAALHLAAATGAAVPAAGLSTAGMIAEGLIEPALRIENGSLRIPPRPGLGMLLQSVLQ